MKIEQNVAQQRKIVAPVASLPAMPLEIEVVGGQPLVTLQARADGDWYLFSDPGLPMLMTASDMHKYLLAAPDTSLLRDRFLTVRTAEEAFRFLQGSYSFIWPMSLQEEHQWTHALSWRDFQGWQRFIAEIGVRGFPFRSGPLPTSPLFWLEPVVCTLVEAEFRELFSSAPLGTQDFLLGHLSGISIRRLPEGSTPRVVMRVEVRTVIEALLASLYFNQVSGITSKKCGLEDCQNIFDLTSKHQRLFCTQEHAHLAGVRRRRAHPKRKAVTNAKA